MDPIWATVVGGLIGVGGATIKDVVTRWFQVKDKDTDRRAVSDDTHRSALRAAYVDFIAAYSNFVDSAGVLISRMTVIEDQREDAYRAAMEGTDGDDEQAQTYRAAAGNPQLVELARKEMELLPGAVKEANTKAINVILLEDEPTFVAHVRGLVDDPLSGPDGPQGYGQFRDGVVLRRRRLDDLTRALAGRFAPASTQRPRLSLPSAPQGPALPPGTDRK